MYNQGSMCLWLAGIFDKGTMFICNRNQGFLCVFLVFNHRFSWLITHWEYKSFIKTDMNHAVHQHRRPITCMTYSAPHNLLRSPSNACFFFYPKCYYSQDCSWLHVVQYTVLHDKKKAAIREIHELVNLASKFAPTEARFKQGKAFTLAFCCRRKGPSETREGT